MPKLTTLTSTKYSSSFTYPRYIILESLLLTLSSQTDIPSLTTVTLNIDDAFSEKKAIHARSSSSSSPSFLDITSALMLYLSEGDSTPHFMPYLSEADSIPDLRFFLSPLSSTHLSYQQTHNTNGRNITKLSNHTSWAWQVSQRQDQSHQGRTYASLPATISHPSSSPFWAIACFRRSTKASSMFVPNFALVSK